MFWSVASVIYVFLLLGLYILIVRLPWLRFFRAFSSVVRQMPGYNPPSRGPARTLPKLLCSMYCFMSFCVLFVCKCVLHNCLRVATQLQLTNMLISICGRSGGILQVDSISTISTRCYNSLCHKFCSPRVLRLHGRIPPLPHMQEIKTSKQLLKQLYYTTPMSVLTDDGPVSYEVGRSLF
jgi:hypothetical protein